MTPDWLPDGEWVFKAASRHNGPEWYRSDEQGHLLVQESPVGGWWVTWAWPDEYEQMSKVVEARCVRQVVAAMASARAAFLRLADPPVAPPDHA